MAYLVPAIESGWFQAALPAIFGDDLKSFREWLPENHSYALTRLHGSKLYDTVDGHYRSPFDLGLGNFINTEHDCIGRDALTKIDSAVAKKKVTLAWNPDDTAALFREMLTPGGRDVRFMHLPVNCDTIGLHYDTLSMEGREAGISAYTAYSTHERTVLSIALVDPDVKIGDEVSIGWGEAGGGYGNHVVPANDIFDIRATVSPAPYAVTARTEYREGSLTA